MNFWKTAFLSLSVTRLWIICWSFILEGSALNERMQSDPWHHYHMGFSLIGLSFLMRSKEKRLAAVGLGIVVEEWAVLLDDFGFMTLDLYLSNLDYWVGIGFIGLICGLLILRDNVFRKLFKN